MALEDIEKNLYKPGWRPKGKKESKPKQGPEWVDFSPENPSEQKQIEIDIPLGKEEIREKISSFKKNVSKKLIIVGAATFVLIAAGVVFYFWIQSKGGELLLEIQGPHEIRSGDIINYEFDYLNQTDRDLTDTEIRLEVPQNTVVINSGDWGQAPLLRRSLGVIEKKSKKAENVSLIFIAPPQSTAKIKASLEYKISSVKGANRVQKSFDINITGSAIEANLNTPKNILANQPFDSTLELKNFSDTDFQNVRVIVGYPDGFTAALFTQEPTDKKNTWDFNKLAANSSATFTIRGMAGGLSKNEVNFSVRYGLIIKNRFIALGETQGIVLVQPFPVSVNILANGSRTAPVAAQDKINYTINYINDSENAFRNIVIEAKLKGDMFDYDEFSSDGKYSSINNTITWNTSVKPSLAVLKPSDNDSVNFLIAAQKDFPADKNNQLLDVEVTISSPDFPGHTGIATDLLKATDALSTKVIGKIAIDQKAFYRDAASLILNKGPWPPRANQATQYTIHWQISTFGNNFKDIKLRSAIPPNVKLTGTAKVSDGIPAPTIDNRSGQISLDIPTLEANIGNGTAPIDIVFQVEATPSTNDINKAITLLQPVAITAQDEFTEVNVVAGDRELTTALTDDSTTQSNEWLVQP